MKLLNKINVLVVGDIVGRGARNAFLRYLPKLKDKYKVDLLIANAENATNGNGLNYKHYLALVKAGCDVITMGNHTFGNKEIYSYCSKADRLVVPCNIKELDKCFANNLVKEVIIKDTKIKVINVLGHDNIKIPIIHPFIKFKEIYDEDSNSIYIVDYHAELTAEKNVFGYELDGKASIMYGTHTHVQTADERILPKGMAYITDVGMVGAKESVIGFDYEEAVKGQWDGSSYSIEVKKPMMINAMLVTLNLNSKKAESVLRINEMLE